jgi:hypothetical protein
MEVKIYAMNLANIQVREHHYIMMNGELVKPVYCLLLEPSVGSKLNTRCMETYEESPTS